VHLKENDLLGLALSVPTTVSWHVNEDFNDLCVILSWNKNCKGDISYLNCRCNFGFTLIPLLANTATMALVMALLVVLLSGEIGEGNSQGNGGGGGGITQNFFCKKTLFFSMDPQKLEF
jgi:hypothetical protein